MPADWSPREIAVVVEQYFELLYLQDSDRPIDRKHFLDAIESTIDRSRGAIEYKLQNISAVLVELGHDWVRKFAPMRHYQGALADEVRRVLADKKEKGSSLTVFDAASDPTDLDPTARLMAASPSELRTLVLKVLEGRPNYSCAKKNLVREVCAASGATNLRGNRRRALGASLGRAIGQLKTRTPPLIKEYRTSVNVRVKLIRRPDATSADSVAEAASQAGLGRHFSAVQHLILKLLVKCPDCGAGITVPFPVDTSAHCRNCSWSSKASSESA